MSITTELALVPALTFVLGVVVGAAAVAWYVKRKVRRLKDNPMQAIGELAGEFGDLEAD